MKENSFRVLLIEDDEDDYILTAEWLREVKGTDYEITWVSKYMDALPAILEGSYDVCLVDYRLGEGTGIELVRKAQASGCLMPMILLTGQGDREIDIKATEAGAADYLVKGRIESQLLERSIRYAVARGRMLETLRESEKRFRSVVESANDAIILTDRQGKIVSWNNSAQNIFGYAQNEILGHSLSILFPLAKGRNLSNDGTDPLLASGLIHSGSKAIELNGLKKDGEEFPLEISLSSWETTEGVFYSGIIRDVTERKLLEDQLIHQALHDPLTQLANRVLFRNRVEHALKRTGRQHSTIAVLFLDLDDFKTINDTLGHATGDELLVSVAGKLRACLRSGDTAARLGGDEFAVLLEDAKHAKGAISVAERIQDMFRTPFSIDGKDVFVNTSIGIAVNMTGNENPEELLRNADMAMFMAKSQGKNRFTFFESAMHEALIRRVELEQDMRQAIEREEFVLYYQPIINLRSKQLVGMEALVRWNHPQRGLIFPNEFIQVAEETNLIVSLGRWILEEACRQARAWQIRHDDGKSRLSVTVNISSRQFQQQTFVEIVVAALTKSGLSPHSLVLEITENTVLEKTEETIKKLQELKNLGVRLAIDDFGTGYSSLSYLQRYPVDILKIDKSFIDKINHGNEGAAVTQAIITMCETLHLTTIAEGIETSEQIAALQNLGCELGQGYHFAKPLSIRDMEAFFRNVNLIGQNGRLTVKSGKIIKEEPFMRAVLESL